MCDVNASAGCIKFNQICWPANSNRKNEYVYNIYRYIFIYIYVYMDVRLSEIKGTEK